MRMSVSSVVADPLMELVAWIHERLFVTFNDVCEWVSVNALQYPDSWVASGTPVQTGVFALVLASYAALVVVGGVVVMTHETLQTRYSVREIAPRLVIGLAAAWAAPLIIDKALDVANAVVEALVSFDRVLVNDKGQAFSGFRANLFETMLKVSGMFKAQPSIADVLLGVVQVVAVAVVFAASIIRKIVLLVCVMFAPAALACHGLPFTDTLARVWWRLFGACIGVSIGQAALVRVWSYTAFDADGLYIKRDDRAVEVLIAIVFLWAMWTFQSRLFTAAIGRPLRIPGSRLAKGFVLGAAAGAGHRLVRRWRHGRTTNPNTSRSPDESTTGSPAARWRHSRGWTDKDGQANSIRVRRPRINKDAWSKATAKPKAMQPQARVATGPVKGRGQRREHLPVLPSNRINPARTTPTPQHGANQPPTPVETIGAGPGTPIPHRTIGPIPRPDPRKFARALNQLRVRTHRSTRRKNDRGGGDR